MEQSNCIDWINLYTVTDQYTAFLVQMYLIHVERRLRNGTSISTDVIENTPENNENNINVFAICIGIFFTLQDPLSVKQIICKYYRVMVFNATFNNISDISWRSVLLVEENCHKSLTNFENILFSDNAHTFVYIAYTHVYDTI